MTTLSVADLHISDPRTLAQCVAFLNRVITWTGFDVLQMVQPCCNDKREFTGFYSKQHHLGFTSFSHTLDETLFSPFTVQPLTFDEFRNWALSLANA